jgi:hypothetical protein
MDNLPHGWGDIILPMIADESGGNDDDRYNTFCDVCNARVMIDDDIK